MMWAIRLRRTLIEYFRFLSRTRGSRRCLILGTPAHKNLGDHAIVYAQNAFLRDYDSDMEIMELSRLEYETYRLIIRITAGRDTLIVVDGGGNIGTLWPGEDALIRDVLRLFRHNKTIVFPQTAYYDESEGGDRLHADMVSLLNSRDNILLMLRDENSYNYFKEKVNGSRLLLCPDIVTYVANANNDATAMRQGVGLCLRDDKESVLGEDSYSAIKKLVNEKGRSCRKVTTISPVNVHKEEREEALNNTWKTFASCEMVITDRLHGMIFSAITGTPCIALNNISRKVEGGYAWLGQLGYVRLCENIDELDAKIEENVGIKECIYDRKAVIRDYYEPVRVFLDK